MAFGLGVAIAELFANIAALLRQTSSGLGGGTGGTPLPSPVVPSPPSPVPPPPPPLPPVPPTPPTNPADCPTLTAGDWLALQSLQYRSSSAILTPSQPYIFPAGQEQGILPTIGTGIPVEAADRFRFRAFGSVGSVAVSFFGRVQLPTGTIIPFNYTLTPDNAGTVSEILPQTGPGILLGAAASVPVGSITSGAINAIGEIGRLVGATFTPHTLLFSGQLNDDQPLSSTLASPAPPVQNPVFFSSTTASTDPSSLSIVATPTSGRRARIVSVTSTLRFSATAFNRQPSVLITAGSTALFRGFSDRIFSANQISQLRAYLGGQPGTTTTTTTAFGILTGVPLPEALYLTSEFTVTVALFTGAVDDLIDGMGIVWEET